MALTRRRTLVRTAAVAAAAGSALLLPAAAAFADSPQPTAAGSPAADGSTAGTPSEKPSENSGKPGDKGDQDKRQNEKRQDDKQQKGERKLVRTQRLSGGFTARVYKLGPDHFQADMYANEPGTGKLVKMDTLETKGGKPAYGQHNGAHFVLQPDGSMTSWVEGGDRKKDDKKDDKKKNEQHEGRKQDARKDQRQPQQTGRQTQVTPKGGVKAGAEGVGGTPDTPAVLLAGGGAAAAAAGLGFALLHRRKAGEDA
ncbi:hypothetical protein [Streptomyces sp. NPDC018045]|uniref:hypothetical protein n=1 Tax=Streptomyces sp. NPDC018045 TaxID=3365037 RepID=UPI0037979223